MGNGKMDKRERCAEAAFSDIASPIVDEAIKQAKEIAGDPSAEGLHQLRISMRRLRSLWWSYRPLLDMGENTRQRDLFRSLADSAGKARDYDILIELLKLQQKDGETLPPEISDARQEALDNGRKVLSKRVRGNAQTRSSRARRLLESQNTEDFAQCFRGALHDQSRNSGSTRDHARWNPERA
ncbi:CHAD domain-containing protein [Paraburkholderia sp. A2RO-4L]